MLSAFLDKHLSNYLFLTMFFTKTNTLPFLRFRLSLLLSLSLSLLLLLSIYSILTLLQLVSSNDALDAVPSDALRSILRSDEMFNQETNKRIQSTPCRVTASKNAIERKCRSQSMSSCPSPSPLHSMDTAAPSRNKSVCLTDFYPHIGMIFTSVYDALGLKYVILFLQCDD